MSLRKILFVAIIALLFVSVQGFDLDDLEFESCESNANLPFTSYVNFHQRLPDGSSGNTLSARLKVPKVNGTLPTHKIPAVVVVHGSAGLDSRGELYSYNLNQIGIATLEIDLWAARGWYGGVTGRPRTVTETLPDTFGALYFLAENVSIIDADRIGVMGFSWGGAVSMLSASTDRSIPLRWPGVGSYKYKFAAHNPHYPICWAYNTYKVQVAPSVFYPVYPFTQTTGKNIFIQTGELDDYDTPTSCSTLISTLPSATQETFDLTVYKGATHGFDRLEPAMTVQDPYAHQGAGGTVQFTPNFLQTAKAVRASMKFFKKELKP